MRERSHIRRLRLSLRPPGPARCGWCHRPLAQRVGAGRPRRFCSRAHRQRAYEARRRADSLQIPPGQVIVAEEDLRTLHDRLYRLEAAIEDVESDLAGKPPDRAYRQAYEHLYESARTWSEW